MPRASRWPLTDDQMRRVNEAIGTRGALAALAMEWGMPKDRVQNVAYSLARGRGMRSTAAMRTCLCCRRKFKSAWIGNRMCVGCKEANQGAMA